MNTKSGIFTCGFAGRENKSFGVHSVKNRSYTENQRTYSPVNAHLLGLVKNKTRKIYGKEMTLTFNTNIPS